jgi:SAM-dependent methyltransferase
MKSHCIYHESSFHVRRVVSYVLAKLRGRPIAQEHTSSEGWTQGNPLERQSNEAVDFAIHSANTLIGLVPGGIGFLQGKTVLEIGAGQDFGFPLILIGLGSRAVLVDKYLCNWDKHFHPSFYRSLRQEAIERFPGINTAAFDQVIEREEHTANGMKTMKTGLEDVYELPDGAIDIHYSNATFEHLADIPASIAQLGRITKPGGVGFHQIDFRDHRNFDRPLDYLTIPDEEFSNLLEKVSWSCGNRWRYTQFQEIFETNGFDVSFTPNLFVKEDYLYEVYPNVQDKFKFMAIDALRVLGGRFALKKS